MKYAEIKVANIAQQCLEDMVSLAHPEGLGKHGARIKTSLLYLPLDLRQCISAMISNTILEYLTSLGVTDIDYIDKFGDS